MPGRKNGAVGGANRVDETFSGGNAGLDLGDDQRTCHLPGSRTAHAISDDPEPEVGPGAEGIFILPAYRTDVTDSAGGNTRNLGGIHAGQYMRIRKQPTIPGTLVSRQHQD